MYREMVDDQSIILVLQSKKALQNFVMKAKMQWAKPGYVLWKLQTQQFILNIAMLQ